MTELTREERYRAALQRIYEEGCMCSLDYGSSCNCEASDIARFALEEL